MHNFNNSSTLEPLTHNYGDYIEIGFHMTIFLIGIPLNTFSLRKQLSTYLSLNQGGCENAIKVQFLLQKLHLNAANLLSLLVICPIQTAWFISYQWLAGDALCKLVLFVWMFVINASSNIVAVIAVERFKNVIILEELWTRHKSVVTHRRKTSRLSKGRTVKPLLWISWVVALVCSLPQLWFWLVLELRPGFHQCTTLWKRAAKPAKFFQTSYNAFHLCTTFWIPFLIIAISYACIAVKLLKLSCYSINSRPSSVMTMRKSGNGGVSTQNVKRSCHVEVTTSADHLLHPDTSKTQNLSHPKSSLHQMAVRKAHSAEVHKSSAVDVSNLVGVSEGETATLTTANGHPLLPEIVGIPSWRLQMRSKIFRTTGLIVLAYALFWLPYNTLGILVFVDEELLKKLERHINWAKSFMLLTAVLNPLLYGW